MDIKNFLQSSYSKENFIEFIYDKFYGFEENDSDYEVPYSESEQKNIQKYKFLGQVELDDAKEIGFFEFLSTANKDIENNRVSLNKILKNKIEDELLDGAIAVFYNPTKPDVWRLSFIRFSYDKHDKQQVTNLKRHTYVLGKDIAINTAYQQLHDVNYSSLNLLEEAFSVEKISKEFFNEYKKIYFEICEYLGCQLALFGGEKGLKLFAKKLLGRIVFIYFLQKKGWLDCDESWQNGDKKFLSTIFFKNNFENFYFDILKPLFFKALNEKRENDYFKPLGCKMPFLNGGLFSEDEFDKLDVILENSIFKNIFKIFGNYNFTIIEDSPNDSEIAIDPEMLGRVFEDLLEDRKIKGAFYTPREIVHYMSKKSIESYLNTQLKEYKYDFSVEDFLHKTTLDDANVLEFYKKHPVKFVKIDNYFTKLHPYKNLVVDFYIVAKLRGFLLNSDGSRTKGSKGHPEITSIIWSKILRSDYKTIAINFGTNKEIKLKKTYKYPTILKYIQIDEQYFSLAFLPNIWGDLELTTIFPIRLKSINNRLRKFDKPLKEIDEINFAFDSKTYEDIKELREDCRSLYAEPLSLFQVEELPRQAVVQKGLSTFHNSFNVKSLADKNLKTLLADKNYYSKFINILLSNSDTPQDELKRLMIIVLKKIKVLDPAIGSGAFPMGVLHEIIDARVHLGDKTPLSKMKREIIQNCIYGIDIEQSAVEIAKLRFWLSIVVDEDEPKPLPNLFYKIMVGNSLLETINGFDPLEKDSNSLFSTDETLIDEIQILLHKFYSSHTNSEKIDLQENIEHKIDDILSKKLDKHNEELRSQLNNITLLGFDKKQTNIIQKLNKDISLTELVKKRPTTELFLYKIYFAEVFKNGGFDLVIGNPPYVRQEKIKELKSKKEIQNFESYNGTADLYIYFFEKGYKLLKENGVLSYITSNKYTRAKYGKEFRKFVLENTNILEYIDFNGVKVFESATVDTSILTYKKSQEKNSSFLYCDVDSSYKRSSELDKFIHKKGFDYFQNDLSIDSFSFASPQELRIKKQIEKIGVPLKDWDININRGILTGFNEAFIIDGKTKDELIAKDSKSAEILKPLLRGKDIKRYHYAFADKWLINSHNNPPVDITKYSAIKKHLDKYYEKLKKRGDKGNTPYNLRNCAFLEEFKKEKIIWTSIAKINTFAYTEKEIFTNDKCFILSGANIKYLLSFLNSKLFFYYYKFDGIQLSSGYEFKKFKVENTPIKKISKEQQKPFETLVDYILFSKEQNMKNEASLFESIIDNMVYDLYFEEDMKKADCYISSRVEKIVKPFGKYDSDNDKKMLIKVIHDIFKEDKTVQRGLVFSRNIEVVKIINGDYKDD